jgi:acyl-[acyl-carrier-protein]-phospholipid O-acyltransferase / long-chain-fatty-acid--[acyl-carrier-protein] ligase
MKRLLRLLARLCFGFRAFNEAVLKTPGPVLLIPNHLSWLDWLFVGVCLDDDWKFVVSSTTAELSWLHRRIMLNRRTFPVDATSPYAVKRMAEHLVANGRLVLFAEGRMSRTGALMKLFDGTGFLLYRTHAKVITCHLRGAQRVLCSPHPGWRKLFPRVTAHFGEVLDPPRLEHLTTMQARNRYTDWLRDQMLLQQFRVETEFGARTLPEAILETARQQPNRVVLEDATMKGVSYRRLLVGARLLAGRWEVCLATPGPAAPLSRPAARAAPASSVSRSSSAMDATGTPMPPARVGVLLPNVNAMPLVLLSLWSAGFVPAILNFSTGPATMLACAELAGLKQIITSRAFLERARLNVQPLQEAGIRFLYLEDLRERITGLQKLVAALRCRLGPRSALRAPHSSESPAVVLFTSGSEGTPKGVELTHANLLANIRQILSVLDVMDTDRFFSALPLFHSFGLTAGVLLPLVRGIFTFLYPSPLHYRMIPTAFYNLDCTVMFGTNTFLNGYARKAHPYDFRSLRYLVCGAEKLQEATVNLWSRQFGVRVIEGYGATECSPVISVNTAMDARFGSAGRLLPGIDYRLEPVEGVAEGGRLFVRGPNVMRGYLNPEANAAFQALGGWYDTGDIVRVDENRFVYILGRLKRFAKVSGEMVSLTAVEDALAGAFPHYGLRCQIAVLSRPDEDKGEALVAVTNEPKLTLDEIRAALKAKGLTNLCVPRGLKVVKEIPKLGTGKVNHRELAGILTDAGVASSQPTRSV